MDEPFKSDFAEFGPMKREQLRDKLRLVHDDLENDVYPTIYQVGNASTQRHQII